MEKISKKTEKHSLNLIKKEALKFGAIAAKIIPTNNIVIEDRVVLKCKLGCKKYGKTLSCPPYAPTPHEFRKIVSEYRNALFMKFKSQAEGNSDIIKHLASVDDPSISSELKTKIEAFWETWKKDTKKVLDIIIKLEKVAAKEGYLLAMGFVSGSCQLCVKCNVEKGQCIHPQMRRYSEEGLGVNVKATAEKAGIEFVLPFEKNLETYALLLID